MTQIRCLFFVGLFLVNVMPKVSEAADKEKLLAQSGNHRVQLVEVYSSESCSSCPPADRWASGLKSSPRLWKDIVPVVFHVDYWNQLGWVDALSSKAMTQRQVDIAHQWAVPKVYTPAVVVDGQEWAGWQGTTDQLTEAAKPSGISLDLYQEADSSYRVQFHGLKKQTHYRLHVAQLGMGLSTQVTGGENVGRKLEHDFVVLNWQVFNIDRKNTSERMSFKNPIQKPLRMALVAWVEDVDHPIPLQSVGNFL